MLFLEKNIKVIYIFAHRISPETNKKLDWIQLQMT